MTDMNKTLSKWREALSALLDDAVEELDRHMAAETEMKSALQLVQSALALLAFLSGKEGEIPEWFSTKLIYDAKQMTVRADAAIQNAFSFDPTIPEHEAMPTSQLADRTVAAITRCEAKIARIRRSIEFLQSSTYQLRPRIDELRARLRRARIALVTRRIRIMQGAVEIIRWGVLEAQGFEVRGEAWNLLEPEEMLPVVDEPEVDLGRARPLPAPSRWVSSIPVSTEVLPTYQP
ncbi:hypothetical protein DFJ73DRAFT_762145 [Zopfochytrium polystomum]|nr:hypothetical protein DFJ73DRAFT_762145 [Zopfochytrium polystomum]